MVGRPDIDSFALFPPDGAALLKQMQTGLSLEEAAKWYEEQYHDTIDMDDFLETLRDLRFLREGDEPAEANVPETLTTTKRPDFWQWVGRATFSPVAWIIYAALFGYCIYDIVRFPILFPVYGNVFFSPYFIIIEAVLFFGQFPGLLFHESFHMLAGRRLGLPSRLSIGRRLYYVVFETVLNGVWSVPSRYRYLPFLVGMLGDIVWFSLLTIIAGATINAHGSVSFIGGMCLALAFETVFRFLWQFYFYLRTDLYYVFTNFFGCVDLHHTANRYLHNLLLRYTGRASKMEDESLWNPQDRQVARWYAPLYIFGYILTISLSLGVGIPISLRFLTMLFDHLTHGYAHLTTEFWDSTIFLGISVLQLGVVAVIFWRERQEKKQSSRKAINAAAQ